jgi:hypothetical protein
MLEPTESYDARVRIFEAQLDQIKPLAISANNSIHNLEGEMGPIREEIHSFTYKYNFKEPLNVLMCKYYQDSQKMRTKLEVVSVPFELKRTNERTTSPVKKRVQN